MTNLHGLLARNRVAPAAKSIDDLFGLYGPSTDDYSGSAGLVNNGDKSERAGAQVEESDPTDRASSSIEGPDETGEGGPISANRFI